MHLSTEDWYAREQRDESAGSALRHYTPWGKYDSPMSAFLYALTMDGAQDRDTGETDWDVWCAQLGRRLLFTDDRGAVWSIRYASETLASAAYDDVDAAYGAWLDTCESDDWDAVPAEPWYCRAHDEYHRGDAVSEDCERYSGRLAAELASAERELDR